VRSGEHGVDKIPEGRYERKLEGSIAELEQMMRPEARGPCAGVAGERTQGGHEVEVAWERYVCYNRRGGVKLRLWCVGIIYLTQNAEATGGLMHHPQASNTQSPQDKAARHPKQ
jgi:hypothetical protein